MRLAILTACFAAAAWGAAAAPASSAEPFYTFIDLTDDYVSFYDRTQGMETAPRVAKFREEFNKLFPGFYDPARHEDTEEDYAKFVAKSFDNFPAIRERFLQVAASFETSMSPARKSFVRAFPDVVPIGEVYLLHSLGEMDGGRRTIGEKNVLVFGADVMARVHNFTDEQPFFHHELFHVYHGQFFKGCKKVWCALWNEGLAVHVAHALNPSANDDQLLLTRPLPIRAAVDANLKDAVCAVRARLQSEDKNDYAPLFRGDKRLNDTLPARFGYYVGYLAAREAGRTRSLQQLAHLSVEEAEPVVASALAALASCPN